MSPTKSQKPTRPKRIPADKPKTQMKPLPNLRASEVAKPTSFDTTKNKYAEAPRVGEPTIEAPGGLVTNVGLGKLETVTNYGNQPDV